MANEFSINNKKNASQEKLLPSITYWQDVRKRLFKNKMAIFSIAILIGIVVLIITGIVLSPYSFRTMDSSLKAGWSWALFKQGHFFGIDQLGRDFFVRFCLGGAISLTIAIAVMLIDGIVGTIYGAISGTIGGGVDTIMMRVIEIFLSIPSLIYTILLLVVLGPGIFSLLFALAITNWLMMAVVVRGEIVRLKEQEFVMASYACGASSWYVIRKHLLPNCMGLIIVRLTFAVPAAIFAEAFLSFIGLGIPAPYASWGTLSKSGYSDLYVAPHLFLIPAIAICLITIACNMLGDALRDAMDPKLRK